MLERTLRKIKKLDRDITDAKADLATTLQKIAPIEEAMQKKLADGPRKDKKDREDDYEAAMDDFLSAKRQYAEDLETYTEAVENYIEKVAWAIKDPDEDDDETENND